MKKYTVKYMMYCADEEHEIEVEATSKCDAYTKATFEEIPNANDGDHPYSAWVDRVEYRNGRIQYFNTCDGLAY